MVQFFSKPSAICTKWCAKSFPPIFGLFAILDRNFGKIVAPPSDECENYVACLKEQSLPEKRSKPRRNRPINGNAMRVRTMPPRTHGAPDSERDKQKNKTRNKSIVPSRTMHTGRILCQSIEKSVNYCVNNNHA